MGDRMITLLNIDCMEYMATVSNKYFDITITDPPYNVGFKYNSHDDNMEDYYGWCSQWLWECERITSGIVAISCGIGNIGIWYNIKKPIWVAAWHKPASMGRCPLGFNNWEPILIYGKPIKQNVDVIRAPIIPDKEIDFHPCPKPLKWATHQLNQFTESGCKVFDPFVGSGTVAIAAYDFDCEFVGCEIDKDYYEAAVKRFEIHKMQQKLF